MSAILSKLEILSSIKNIPPLIENYISLDEQVQSNGIDLTLRDISTLQSSGSIGEENNQRVISNLASLVFDKSGYINLASGAYVVTYNEIVNLPRDVMALGTARSSFLRCGVAIHTAVWDAGYSGRSQSLLTVYNPQGFRLQKNARITQLVFYKLTEETEAYHGTYQKENII